MGPTTSVNRHPLLQEKNDFICLPSPSSPRGKKSHATAAPPSSPLPSRRRRPWTSSRPPRSPPPPALSRSPSPLPRSTAGAVPPSSPSPPPSVRVHPSPSPPLPERLVWTSLLSGSVILTHHEPSAGHDDDEEAAKGSGSGPGREPTSLAPYGLSISPLSKVRTRRRLTRRNHPPSLGAIRQHPALIRSVSCRLVLHFYWGLFVALGSNWARLGLLCARRFARSHSTFCFDSLPCRQQMVRSC